MPQDPPQFYWGIIVMFVGIGAFCLGLAIAGYQIIGWLHYGHWDVILVRDAGIIPHPQLQWIGAQKLIEWFLEMSLALALCGAGSLLFLLGLTLMERR